jgi:hypothetical protein
MVRDRLAKIQRDIAAEERAWAYRRHPHDATACHMEVMVLVAKPRGAVTNLVRLSVATLRTASSTARSSSVSAMAGQRSRALAVAAASSQSTSVASSSRLSIDARSASAQATCWGSGARPSSS